MTARAAFVVVFASAWMARGAQADNEAAARKHAARANKLAAQNKCRSALPEFNRAYATLKDPSLLFNRAECERKMGKTREALMDYEQFLIETPSAPNRASVEARIAELRGTAPAPAGEAAARATEEDTRPAPSAQELGNIAPERRPTLSPPKDAGAKVDTGPSPRRAQKWD